MGLMVVWLLVAQRRRNSHTCMTQLQPTGGMRQLRGTPSQDWEDWHQSRQKRNAFPQPLLARSKHWFRITTSIRRNEFAWHIVLFQYWNNYWCTTCILCRNRKIRKHAWKIHYIKVKNNKLHWLNSVWPSWKPSVGWFLNVFEFFLLLFYSFFIS